MVSGNMASLHRPDGPLCPSRCQYTGWQWIGAQLTLEMTLLGPSMVAQKDMLLSLCGADMEADVDGIPVPLWRPFILRKGESAKCSLCS